MADAVESSVLADDTPGRRARQRSAWRLLLEHVNPYRWTILCGGLLGFLGGLASLAQPMAAKLAVDTLGQRRSLAGPVALLAAVTIGSALFSMGHRVSAGAAQPEDLMRPSVPSAAGRGIGTRLLNLAEDHARSLHLGEVRLYTNEAMTEKLSYYPRHGYVETHRAEQDGFRRVYFRKPLD